jgi:hypothetical protein
VGMHLIYSCFRWDLKMERHEQSVNAWTRSIEMVDSQSLEYNPNRSLCLSALNPKRFFCLSDGMPDRSKDLSALTPKRSFCLSDLESFL